MAKKGISREAAQVALAAAALTDSGDHTIFNHATATLFSGYEKASQSITRLPVALPNGMITPINFIVNSTNDVVSWPACKANIEGDEIDISAGTASVTREVTNAFMIASVTVAATGTVTITEGTAHATAIDTSARSGAGQAPLVPVAEVEMGQVHLDSVTPAPFTATELKNVQGNSMEMSYYPTFDIAFSRVTSGVIGKAGVTFTAALPLIHTGNTAKKVWITNAFTPEFASWRRADNFSEPTTSITSSSTPSYDGPVSSDASSISGGSFDWIIDNSVTDSEWQSISTKTDKMYLWWKFFPNVLKTAEYILVQAAATGSSTNPEEGTQQISVTLSPKNGAERVFA